MNLNDIYKPVTDDLVKVEHSLDSITDVDILLLSQLLSYLLKDGGKRIRPAFTLLGGKFYDYDLSRLVPMASALELLHSATLVHDDIVDKSATRRGKPSISSAWGESCALLLGDYLFAKAGNLVASTGNLRVVSIFSQTLMTISSGELAQINIAFDSKRARHHYYTWISAKTACLFTTATECGAILSNAPENVITALKDYGQNFGMAFQIIDDVLDFTGLEAELGKPVGSDLAGGAMTLPSIIYAESNPDGDLIKAVIENKDETYVSMLINKIRSSSAIEQCNAIAADFCAQARKSLELLPDSPAHQSLHDLTSYILKRKK
jgi:heptaprenyl diphosphate synthase